MSIRNSILICILSCSLALVVPSSAKPLGAWDQVDLNDPMLAKVLVFAMQNLTADGSTYVDPHVTQAQSQVVAGLKYRFTVQAARASNPSNHETHQFIVWYRPGGAMQVLQHQLMSAPAAVAAPSIEATREKQSTPLSGHRHRMGGYSPVDVNDPQVQKLAAFGLQEINSRSNSALKFALTRVVRAARQVVAGLQYRIVLELSMADHPSEFHFITVWDHFGTLKFVNHHICESDAACTLQRPHSK